jgi:hypothetical protein
MRITRSGLRRIIAEESARILAEANDERVPGGHQMRIAAGFEDEPAEEDWDDEEEEEDDYDDGGDWYLEEGDGGDYDYDYEEEPEAEMGDPEDPYGDLPKGEHPRGGLVHTAGFKGDSPAKSLLRRREEFPEHPSGLTGMGGPYSEYDHLHYGAGINEARWAKLAGVLKG